MTIEYIPTLPFPSDINSIEDVVGYQERLYQSLTDYFTQMAIIISDEVATVDLDDLANTTLVDPDADRIVFWDDGAGVYTWLTANTGLAISGTNLNLSHLGLESLSDPGADRIFFWDDGETAAKWLAPDGTTVQISGTTLSVVAGGIDHGSLGGLSDDDHTQYIKHALSTAASDFLVGSGSNTFIKKTLAETGAILEGDINHDNLQGFVADEHIAHSGVTITAGTGLTGGGDISSNRTISLSHLGIESLADPNDDQLVGWDDTDGAMKFIDIGSGLSYDHATHTLSSTGSDSEKVKVDAAATADYIGAASNSGVLRTSSPLTYADGGDYVTLGIDETAIDHDNLLNYDSDEHIDWTAVANNGAIYVDGVRLWDTNDSHSMLVYWASDATANQSLSIYGKKGGSLVFGDGSTYSLTIEANSVINQDLSSDASPTLADLTLSSPSNIYALSHDSFADFVANEHIDWTNASENLSTSGNIFTTAGYYYAPNDSALYFKNVGDTAYIKAFGVNTGDNTELNYATGKQLLFQEAGGTVMWLAGGRLGIGVYPPVSCMLAVSLSTENFEMIDAGSAGATEQDWIQVEIGGNAGYIRVYASK